MDPDSWDTPQIRESEIQKVGPRDLNFNKLPLGILNP